MYILRIESNRKGGGVLLFHFKVIKKSVQLDLKITFIFGEMLKCLFGGLEVFLETNSKLDELGIVKSTKIR